MQPLPNETKIREAALDFFNGVNFANPVAVTLTFREVPRHGASIERISSAICGDTLRHFLKRLNRLCHGHAAERHGKHIKNIAVLEQQASGRFHYHIQIDRPASISPIVFKTLIEAEWLKTRWGHREIAVRFGVDDGWILYLTKYRTKASLADSIDWVNITV